MGPVGDKQQAFEVWFRGNASAASEVDLLT